MGDAATAAGVITAWGVSRPIEAVRAWLNSPPHKAIMLDSRYTIAGATIHDGIARVVFVDH
jgi:uncharacterized protein YkwD